MTHKPLSKAELDAAEAECKGCDNKLHARWIETLRRANALAEEARTMWAMDRIAFGSKLDREAQRMKVLEALRAYLGKES